MGTTTRTKLIVAGGAAALTLGIAVPAVAHSAGDGDGGQGQHQKRPETLAEAKAQATRLLTKETAQLSKVKQEVAADDNLSDAEKATYTAKVDAALASVAKASSAVGDATTVAQVRAAVRSASPRVAVPHPDQPTLAERKQHATAWLDAAAAKLTALKAKVAADDRLTADQKAAATSRIDAELASVATARTAVADATSSSDVAHALAAAHLVPVHYPRHHAAKTGATAVSPRSGAQAVTVADRTAGATDDANDDRTTGRDGRDCADHDGTGRGDRATGEDRDATSGHRDGGREDDGGTGDHHGRHAGGHHGGGHGGRG